MKTPFTAATVGTLVVAGGAAAIALTTGGAHAAPPTKVNLVSASSSAAAADQSAVAYVDQNFTGNAMAAVLKTEADAERGVPVYDVLVKAPNGAIYSLSIRTSNDSVLSAHPAETQGAPSPTQTTPAPGNSFRDTPVPEPKQTPEPVATATEATNSQTSHSPGNNSQDSKDLQASISPAKADN